MASAITKRFDSIGDAVKFVLESPHKFRHDSNDDRSKWYGYKSLAGACQYILGGADKNSRAMREAVALLDKVDSAAHSRHKDSWQASPVGAFPVVPEYLAGLPLSMRHRIPDENDRAPIRVFFESSVSAGVNENELVRRGAAVAALAQRMSEERPTELYVADALGIGGRETAIFSIRLDTCPINLAQAVAVFASSEFARKFAFNLCDAVTGEQGGAAFNGGWGFGYPGVARGEKMREALGMEPQDILLQGGFLTDAAMMERDPVGWVNKFLDAQRTLED